MNGAVEQAVLLGGVEVFAVDPDHVDASALGAGLLLPRQLGQDVLDVHPHHLQGDVVLLPHIVGHIGVQPVVPVLIPAPAVEGDGGAPGGLHDLVPAGGGQVQLAAGALPGALRRAPAPAGGTAIPAAGGQGDGQGEGQEQRCQHSFHSHGQKSPFSFLDTLSHAGIRTRAARMAL